MPIDDIIHQYLLCLAQAWTKFGGLHPRIQDDLNTAARDLGAGATFLQQHDNLICTIRHRDSRKYTTASIEDIGDLDLGKLDQVCKIRDSVTDYRITPRTAVLHLESLMQVQKYKDIPFTQLGLVFCLAAMFCVLCCHGSVLDMLAAGVFAVVVSIPRSLSIQKSEMLLTLHEQGFPIFSCIGH